MRRHHGTTGEAPTGGPVLAACRTAKTELLLLVIIRHLHLGPSRSSLQYWLEDLSSIVCKLFFPSSGGSRRRVEDLQDQKKIL